MSYDIYRVDIWQKTLLHFRQQLVKSSLLRLHCLTTCLKNFRLLSARNSTLAKNYQSIHKIAKQSCKETFCFLINTLYTSNIEWAPIENQQGYLYEVKWLYT